MTRAAQIDGCGHGWAPGCCTQSECRNSARAKSLYTDDTRSLRLALKEATVRIRDLERQLAAATGSQPHPFTDRALRFAESVGDIYGISGETVLCRGRYKCVAEARFVLYYVCRKVPVPVWSYPEIALALRGRDHSTIMNGVRQIESRMVGDEHLAHRVARALSAARSDEEQHVETISIDDTPEIPELVV